MVTNILVTIIFKHIHNTSETFCLIDIGINIGINIVIDNRHIGVDTHKLFSPHLGFESFLLLLIFGRGRAATDWFNPFT